jgi:hypothetical protein
MKPPVQLVVITYLIVMFLLNLFLPVPYGMEGEFTWTAAIISLMAVGIGYSTGSAFIGRDAIRKNNRKLAFPVIGVLVAVFSGYVYFNLFDTGGISEKYIWNIRISFALAVGSFMYVLGFFGRFIENWILRES